MIFQSTHVLVSEHTIDLKPYTRGMYDATVDGDVTDDKRIVNLVLGKDLIFYLNQYFSGWKLVKMVEECERPRMGKALIEGQWVPAKIRLRFKRVAYLIELETDADAETVRSRLGKGSNLATMR